MHAGAQHFDRDFGAALLGVQRGEVHLCNGRAGDRAALEGGEQRVDGFAERALDDGHRDIGVERRNIVLKPGEFVGDVGRQQVAARREHLPELHKYGTEAFQRQAKTFAAWLGQWAAQGQYAA